MKKLTAPQQQQLKWIRLGGDGADVFIKGGAHRTFEALERRGLVERGNPHFSDATYFEITDAGREIADKLP